MPAVPSFHEAKRKQAIPQGFCRLSSLPKKNKELGPPAGPAGKKKTRPVLVPSLRPEDRYWAPVAEQEKKRVIRPSNLQRGKGEKGEKAAVLRF